MTRGPLDQGAQEAVYRYPDCGIFAASPPADDESFRRRAPSPWLIPLRFRTNCCTPKNLPHRRARSAHLCPRLAPQTLCGNPDCASFT